MSLKDSYIILFGHDPLGKQFFDDLKALGHKIYYIGDHEVFIKESDKYLEVKLPEEFESGVKGAIEQFHELNILGAICQVENLLPLYSQFCDLLKIPINSSRSYQISRDKFQTRRIQKENSLLCTKFEFYKTDIAFSNISLTTPFILKPNYGVASAGVFLIKNEEEFNLAQKKIKRMNKFLLKNSGEDVGLLCEEYIHGEEISLESISRDGKVFDILYCDKVFHKNAPFNDYIYSTPSMLNDNHRKKIQTFLTIFFEKIGYKNGPSHSEFIISESTGDIHFLESGLRVGYIGNLGKLAEHSLGIPYNQLAILASLKQISLKELIESLKEQDNSNVISFTPNIDKKGIIKEFQGLDFLSKNKDIIHFQFNKNIGDFVSPPPQGMDVIGEVVFKVTKDKALKDVIEEFEKNFKIIIN